MALLNEPGYDPKEVKKSDNETRGDWPGPCRKKIRALAGKRHPE